MSKTYEALLRDELANKPLDRALLSTFAELVRTTGSDAVVDAGCGPGRITEALHQLDLDAYGFDLSPGMIAVARRTYPHLHFEVGDIARLRDANASLGGVVAWYSTIHTPPDELPAVFAEFRRVLRAEGWLLMAFQIGDGRVHRSNAYGHDVDLDNYLREVRHVAPMLERAALRGAGAPRARTRIAGAVAPGVCSRPCSIGVSRDDAHAGRPAAHRLAVARSRASE